MGHIFISYSHEDKDYVHRLQSTLQKEGFHVWVDDRIDYGDEWPMVIQDQLDSCDAMILVASENSYRSKWVQKEVARAQRIEKPFFPLLLSGAPWLSIESTQYVDVTNSKMPPEKFYDRLAHVTPRNKYEHPQTSFESEEKPEPIAGSGTKRSSFNPIMIGIVAVFVIGIVILLSSKALFKNPPTPEPTGIPESTYLPSPTIAITATTVVTQTTAPTEIANEIIEGSAQMVLIPQGDFSMGSRNGLTDEKPVNTVFLDSYYIDKYKVTNALYKLCVDSKVCASPKFSNSYLRPSYYGDPRYDQYPVIGVDWYMAKVYCEWRGGVCRLRRNGKRLRAVRMVVPIRGVRRSTRAVRITTITMIPIMSAIQTRWTIIQTASALLVCLIWPVMPGNGWQTYTTKIIMPLSPVLLQTHSVLLRVNYVLSVVGRGIVTPSICAARAEVGMIPLGQMCISVSAARGVRK